MFATIIFTTLYYFQSYTSENCIFKPIIRISQNKITIVNQQIYLLSESINEYQFFKNKFGRKIIILPPVISNNNYYFDKTKTKTKLLSTTNGNIYAIKNKSAFWRNEGKWKMLKISSSIFGTYDEDFYAVTKEKILILQQNKIINKIKLPKSATPKYLKMYKHHIVFFDFKSTGYESLDGGNTWKIFSENTDFEKLIVGEKECYLKKTFGVTNCGDDTIYNNINDIWIKNGKILFLKKDVLKFKNSTEDIICSKISNKFNPIKLLSDKYIFSKGCLFEISSDNNFLKSFSFKKSKPTQVKNFISSYVIPETGIVFVLAKTDDFLSKYLKQKMIYSFYITLNWSFKKNKNENYKGYNSALLMYDF